MYKVLVFWKFRGPFLHERTVFAPNPSNNLKIKYWRFQKMWNLKIDFGTTFWDSLTLHPLNSKSCLPKTGTFRYVEPHILLILYRKCSIVPLRFLAFVIWWRLYFDNISFGFLMCLENSPHLHHYSKCILINILMVKLFPFIKPWWIRQQIEQ